jgi:hypothetical protein
MLRGTVGFSPIYSAIALVLLLPCAASSWAAWSKEEMCDVNADLALGLEDYPAAITLIGGIAHAQR